MTFLELTVCSCVRVPLCVVFSQLNPEAPIPGIFELHNALAELTRKVRSDRDVALIPLDMLFSPQIPGWIEMKRKLFLHRYLPELVSRDDLHSLSSTLHHSESSRTLFVCCRSFLNMFKVLAISGIGWHDWCCRFMCKCVWYAWDVITGTS